MLTFNQFIEKIDQLEEAKVLIAALQLRIFTLIGKKGLSLKKICWQANTHSEGTEPLLNALVAMGALKKIGKEFFNTSVTYKNFCESSKDYKKGIVMLRKEHRNEWEQLLKTVRNGRDLSDYVDEDDPKFRRLFTYAMHERSINIAPKIGNIVGRKSVGSLLDLGGGPGSYSIAILQKDKKATATLFDRSAAITVAKEITRNMKNRFRLLVGDIFNDSIEDSYDTIYVSNNHHIYNEKENLVLLKKIHHAMVSGGRLVIVDLFLKDNRYEPYDAAMFSLTMLLFTATGKTYTFNEIERLLKNVGFYKFKRFHLGKGNSIIEAVKR